MKVKITNIFCPNCGEILCVNEGVCDTCGFDPCEDEFDNEDWEEEEQYSNDEVNNVKCLSCGVKNDITETKTCHYCGELLNP